MRRRPVDEAVSHSPSLDFSIWRTSAEAMRDPHTHPDIEVNYLRKGRVSYLLGGRFIELKPNDVVIFWAGMPHQTLGKSREVEGIWMTLSLTGLLQSKHVQEAAVRLLKGEIISYKTDSREDLTFERWREDFSTADPALREIVLDEIVCHLGRLSLSLAGRDPRGVHLSPTGGNERMEKILRHLAMNYRNKMTTEDIAGAVGLHPKYLLALFRRACRMTLWDYVILLRLAHAQRLLLTTNRTVTDIAFDAGFHSLSAFYHAFRHHGTGKSPAAFRKANFPGGK